MAEIGTIEQIVARVVSEVLENHLPQVRDELVRRVLETLQPQLQAQTAGSGTRPAAADAASLLKALVAIQEGTSQKEILRALLDATVRYCGRSALFVVKPGTATGWEARGFSDDEAIKDFSLDINSGVFSQVMQSRATASAARSDMDAYFLEHVHPPEDDHVLLLPLLVKNRVAAVVYADSGQQPGNLDQPALEILATATSAWLEVASLRKQSQREAIAEPPHEPQPEAAASYSDPFAAHAPLHAAAAGAAAPPISEMQPVSGEAHAAAASPDATTALSPEDLDLHRKAQRFARLLVDEIKLYNQAKVAEGRKHRDIYDRLKEDIEKSRSTYQKRYGSSAAAAADYFNNELVRSLAEDDSSLMGANFRR